MEDFKSQSENQLTLSEQLTPYLRIWPYVILSVFLCVAGAMIYMRYATNIYQADASIIIKDTRRGGGGLSEIDALGELGILGNSQNSVENEIEVLKSKRLMSYVIDELDLDITYQSQGKIKDFYLYKAAPVVLQKTDNQSIKSPVQLEIEVKNDSSFYLKSLKDDKIQEIRFGANFKIDDHEFIITPRSVSISNNIKSKNKDKASIPITIKIVPIDKLASTLSSKLQVSLADRRSSVLKLSLTDQVGAKAEDILNELVVQYNKDAIMDKNMVAQKTLDFIEERLKNIENDLDSVELGIQSFKDKSRVTDLLAETALDLKEVKLIEGQLVQVQSEINLATAAKNSVISNLGNKSIIGVVGIDDASVNSMLSKYNEFISTYKRIESSSTPENPTLQTLNSEIEGLSQSIASTVDNYLKGLEFKKKNLQKQLNATGYNISKVPVKERISRNNTRNRNVVEAIYLLLREKKETTAISLAVAAPKAKIVDVGYSSKTPVSPKPKIIYLAALLIGLLIPIGMVYLKTLFYNKVESRKDIENELPNLAILGELPRLEKSDKDYIESNDRSILAEAFRILRTNLYYKLNSINDLDQKTKIITVTSVIQGEGKTFVSFNLATTMATPDKKVLLLGADIRNPQVHRYISSKNARKQKGLTDYITNSSITATSIIYTSAVNKNLDIMLSGAIPPNPAELLMHKRVDTLFNELKNDYDLIIVDTAPTLLVTDTFLLNKYSDLTLFVSKANHTDKALLRFIKDTSDTEKLNNVSIVLNNVKLTNFGYGNKYGYSYGKKEETRWNKLLKFLRIR